MTYAHTATGKATAPYNFVPLPQRVWFAQDDPPSADRFHTDRRTGWIDVEATLETPLSIGGRCPDPFLAPDGRPVIPGSSLRGALRTLVEILTFAKLANVSREQPFYRSVGDDRVGKLYRDRIVGTAPDGASKVRAGVLRRRGDEWVIEPRRYVKVSYEVLASAAPSLKDLRQMKKGNRSRAGEQGDGLVAKGGIERDRHERQVRPLYGQRVALEEDDRRSASRGASAPMQAKSCQLVGSGEGNATLVPSGWMTNKTSEFAILDEPDGDSVEVPEPVIRRFNSDDQLTQHQEKWFEDRTPKGWLKDDELVFFVTGLRDGAGAGPDDDHILDMFLGRPGMFRLPYDRSPADLLPPEHHDERLDLAEAIFGRVRKGEAIRGRIRVGDLVADKADTVEAPPTRLRILSSPKITNVAHYLTQGSGRKANLTSYFTADETTVRGHKLYWHRWEDGRAWKDQVALPPGQDKSGSQSTQVRVVLPGPTFSGRVHFENLTDVELGALLTALRLWPGSRHRLGMGKPLGLGTVQLSSSCTVLDLAGRYAAWSQPAEQSGAAERAVDAFAAAVDQHCTGSGEPEVPRGPGIDATPGSLRRWARLDVLARLVEWVDRPSVDATKQMVLDDFKMKEPLPAAESVALSGTAYTWPGPLPQAHERADPDRRPPPVARPQPPTRAPTAAPGALAPGQRTRAVVGPAKKGKPTLIVDGKKASFGPNPVPGDLVQGSSIDVVVTFVPTRLADGVVIVKAAD